REKSIVAAFHEIARSVSTLVGRKRASAKGVPDIPANVVGPVLSGETRHVRGAASTGGRTARPYRAANLRLEIQLDRTGAWHQNGEVGAKGAAGNKVLAYE